MANTVPSNEGFIWKTSIAFHCFAGKVKGLTSCSCMKDFIHWDSAWLAISL